ncbi:hypothetical protein RclHR1_10090003 [Rhizophagus clarus]|uniref:VWFA domain-containing protein n=1 Tax=Rhizophagus clarus TaxID=94130 RepID=A0A2Z6QSR5_9GLOM|nr:hypothetical protein RclHR1_10090003 [Rhizophagus clarus]GES89408.1 hypothetical protein GLOIN_2v1648923 [Rhizophagus clarus]
MSYGATITEFPRYDDSSKVAQSSQKSAYTSFAEFLESKRLMVWGLIFTTIDIVALAAVILIRLEDVFTQFIELLLKLSLVINIMFAIDVLLRIIVFGPMYFRKGKHGLLHAFDAFLVLAALSVGIFLKIKETELIEVSLLSLRYWRIFTAHVKVIEYKYPAFHIILVMDRSGSMNGTDITPTEKSRNYAKLKNSHDNRLGAVYDAVYSFMDARLQTRYQPSSRTPLITDRIDRDTISLVLFDDEADVIFENEKIKADFLFNKMLEYQTRGGTDFGVAIEKADLLINKHFDATKTNIVIFLSDGEADVPEYDLDSICKRNAKKNSPIYLHTVLFGLDTGSDSLERMVDIAKKYTPPGPVTCSFTKVMDEVVLTNLFTSIASNLREHKKEYRWWLFQITN